MRELASKRKETEPDFEQKRMNLKVEDEAIEFNRNDQRGSHGPNDPHYTEV